MIPIIKDPINLTRRANDNISSIKKKRSGAHFTQDLSPRATLSSLYSAISHAFSSLHLLSSFRPPRRCRRRRVSGIFTYSIFSLSRRRCRRYIYTHGLLAKPPLSLSLDDASEYRCGGGSPKMPSLLEINMQITSSSRAIRANMTELRGAAEPAKTNSPQWLCFPSQQRRAYRGPPLCGPATTSVIRSSYNHILLTEAIYISIIFPELFRRSASIRRLFYSREGRMQFTVRI